MSKLLMMIAAAWLLAAGGAFAAGDHSNDDDGSKTLAETVHDQMERRSGPRLIMPMMNSMHGRFLFASKGCVTCHSVNGIGGEDAPNLDAHTMQPYMNLFEFAARMWRGAATMIAMQEEANGKQVEFTGEELADIIAFLHDEQEQHKFTEADIPPEIMSMMDHKHGDTSGTEAHADELGHGTEEGAEEDTDVGTEHGHDEGTEAHTD